MRRIPLGTKAEIGDQRYIELGDAHHACGDQRRLQFAQRLLAGAQVWQVLPGLAVPAATKDPSMRQPAVQLAAPRQ